MKRIVTQNNGHNISMTLDILQIYVPLYDSFFIRKLFQLFVRVTVQVLNVNYHLNVYFHYL